MVAARTLSAAAVHGSCKHGAAEDIHFAHARIPAISLLCLKGNFDDGKTDRGGSGKNDVKIGMSSILSSRCSAEDEVTGCSAALSVRPLPSSSIDHEQLQVEDALSTPRRDRGLSSSRLGSVLESDTACPHAGRRCESLVGRRHRSRRESGGVGRISIELWSNLNIRKGSFAKPPRRTYGPVGSPYYL
jgi:hypothetical protein